MCQGSYYSARNWRAIKSFPSGSSNLSKTREKLVKQNLAPSTDGRFSRLSTSRAQKRSEPSHPSSPIVRTRCRWRSFEWSFRFATRPKWPDGWYSFLFCPLWSFSFSLPRFSFNPLSLLPLPPSTPSSRLSFLLYIAGFLTVLSLTPRVIRVRLRAGP